MATLTLRAQSSLAQDPEFLRRTQQAIVTTAVSVSTETANDVQTVSFGGTVTGGTYTLTFNGTATAAIAWNALAGAVQTALQALTNIGSGNVVVNGGPGPGTPYTVTFTGALGNMPQPVMTTTSSLTGTSPTVSVAHTTTGVAVVNHAARATFAKTVLNNPSGYAALMAPAITAGTAVQGDFVNDPVLGWTLANGVSETTADTDVLTRASAIWNSYI